MRMKARADTQHQRKRRKGGSGVQWADEVPMGSAGGRERCWGCADGVDELAAFKRRELATAMQRWGAVWASRW